MGLVILVDRGNHGHNLKQCGMLKNTVNLKTRDLGVRNRTECSKPVLSERLEHERKLFPNFHCNLFIRASRGRMDTATDIGF